MVGIRPFGLSSRYHGSFCSRFSKSMRRTLYGRASSSSVMEAFHPFGVAAVNSSIMISTSNPTLHDSSAARSGAAQCRDGRMIDDGAHGERAADADHERSRHEPA